MNPKPLLMEGRVQINKAIVRINLEIIEKIEERTNMWPSPFIPGHIPTEQNTPLQRYLHPMFTVILSPKEAYWNQTNYQQMTG